MSCKNCQCFDCQDDRENIEREAALTELVSRISWNMGAYGAAKVIRDHWLDNYVILTRFNAEFSKHDASAIAFYFKDVRGYPTFSG